MKSFTPCVPNRIRETSISPESSLLRVVVDPGVLVSAIITRRGGGAPSQLLTLWLDGRFTPIVSDKLLDELNGVLHRVKFQRYITTGQVGTYLTLLRETAEIYPDPPIDANQITADPDDDYLVALTLVAGGNILVSGDAHLTGHSGDALRVLTPRQFVDLFERLQPAS